MAELVPNSLYYGDCLEVMQGWSKDCIDLIYLDPPFNSDADYNVLYSSESAGIAQMRAFADTWSWDEAASDRLEMYQNASGRPAHKVVVGLHNYLGECGMLAYITYMAQRIEGMHRVLTPSGSIYLHCDPTASHYLKAVMDSIFGGENFKSEIIWKRTSAHNRANRWGPIHDTILFYTMSDTYTWNPVYQSYDEDYLKKHYRGNDDKGRFRISDLTGSGTRKGESGLPWRDYDPTVAKRHWALPSDRGLPGWFIRPDGYSEMPVQERLDVLDAQGLVYWPPQGKVPQFKRYLDAMRGVQVQDIINDIPPVSGKEDTGYPTQKPVALMDRILKSSSNEGDIVLDPFCGCGTTLESARGLNRQFIGIDISSFAIDVIRVKRLKDSNIPAQGIPYDLASAKMMHREKPFDFETWAVNRLPGFVPNIVKVGDSGIDGRATLANRPDNINSRLGLTQVKGGKFKLSDLRDFIHVCNRENAAIGIFLTIDPVDTSAARKEVANTEKIKVGANEYRRIQLWSISDFFENRMPEVPIMNDPYTGKPIPQVDWLSQQFTN